MKRKFVKVMFFGALALSTVTYVGCKDYDDDIDNLQTQIDANKASIADLQKFVDAGFRLKEIIIKEQHNCKSTGYWEKQNNNFLLLAHEYIFVFEK